MPKPPGVLRGQSVLKGVLSLELPLKNSAYSRIPLLELYLTWDKHLGRVREEFGDSEEREKKKGFTFWKILITFYHGECARCDVVAEGVDLDTPIGVAPCLLDTARTQPSVVISKKIYDNWLNRHEKWPLKFMCPRFAEFLHI